MTSPLNTPRAAVAAIALALAAFAGLPAAAQRQPKPSKTEPALPEGIAPFEVAQVTSGSWYGRFGLTNCAWLELGDGVLVVDTGGSAADAANLQKQIKETTKGKPIKWIVLTHLHGDSNDGLKSFLPTDATIFVNAKVAGGVALAVQPRDAKAKAPTVVGVQEHSVLVTAGRRLEIGTPATGAHTNADLYLFDPQTGAAYVGDLITPGRCPMMSDPTDDPKGWLKTLDDIQALHPSLLVPTRADASKLVENELSATRRYIERVLELVVDMKKRGVNEARVAAELQSRKLGEYCPVQLDGINTVTLFKRANDKGVIAPPAAPPVLAPPKKKS